MQRKDHVDTFGIVTLIIWSGVLGLNQSLVKLVNAGFSPVFQAGLRSVCAFFIVLAAAMFMRKRLSISDGSFNAGIVIGLLFAAEFYLLFTALDYTTVSRVSLFFYTQPFWVAIGAHFLIPGERLNQNKILGLTMALSGIVLAFTNGSSEASSTTLLGDLMCLVAAVFWAMIALMPRTTKISVSTPEMQLLYQLAVSGIILTVVALLVGNPIREVTPMVLSVFAVQVVFIVSIGFLFWFWAISIYPSSEMASFGLLAPIFGVFFGWLIFDDQIGWKFIMALGLVCAGILLSNRKSPAKESAAK